MDLKIKKKNAHQLDRVLAARQTFEFFSGLVKTVHDIRSHPVV
jgi:hypothetical protein